MTLTPDAQALADNLRDATESGDLTAAYVALKRIPANILLEVGLRAGFRGNGASTPRAVMEMLAPQVVAAVRDRTTRNGLR